MRDGLAIESMRRAIRQLADMLRDERFASARDRHGRLEMRAEARMQGPSAPRSIGSGTKPRARRMKAGAPSMICATLSSARATIARSCRNDEIGDRSRASRAPRRRRSAARRSDWRWSRRARNRSAPRARDRARPQRREDDAAAHRAARCRCATGAARWARAARPAFHQHDRTRGAFRQRDLLGVACANRSIEARLATMTANGLASRFFRTRRRSMVAALRASHIR